MRPLFIAAALVLAPLAFAQDKPSQEAPPVEPDSEVPS
jgi:hypothetical protein